MAITQAMCTSFKLAMLNGEVDFSADTAKTYKLALYTSAATLGATTTAYTVTNEVSGTGYTAGGATLTIISPTISGTTAFVDFADVVFAGATITARGALIYEANGGTNPSVAVLDFGADRTSSGGDFTIIMPTASAALAAVRVA